MAKMSLKEQREWHRHRPEGAAGVWATVGETGVKIGSAAGLGGLGVLPCDQCWDSARAQVGE